MLAQIHSRAHICVHTNTRTHAHTYAYTHIHAHTRTHIHPHECRVLWGNHGSHALTPQQQQLQQGLRIFSHGSRRLLPVQRQLQHDLEGCVDGEEGCVEPGSLDTTDEGSAESDWDAEEKALLAQEGGVEGNWVVQQLLWRRRLQRLQRQQRQSGLLLLGERPQTSTQQVRGLCFSTNCMLRSAAACRSQGEERGGRQGVAGLLIKA